MPKASRPNKSSQLTVATAGKGGRGGKGSGVQSGTPGGKDQWSSGKTTQDGKSPAVYCPLCIEELDETEKKFYPCPCGYQVCLFCLDKLRNECNKLCPGCRQTYDDDPSVNHPPPARPPENSKHPSEVRGRVRPIPLYLKPTSPPDVLLRSNKHAQSSTAVNNGGGGINASHSNKAIGNGIVSSSASSTITQSPPSPVEKSFVAKHSNHNRQSEPYRAPVAHSPPVISEAPPPSIPKPTKPVSVVQETNKVEPQKQPEQRRSDNVSPTSNSVPQSQVHQQPKPAQRDPQVSNFLSMLQQQGKRNSVLKLDASLGDIPPPPGFGAPPGFAQPLSKPAEPSPTPAPTIATTPTLSPAPIALQTQAPSVSTPTLAQPPSPLLALGTDRVESAPGQTPVVRPLLNSLQQPPIASAQLDSSKLLGSLGSALGGTSISAQLAQINAVSLPQQPNDVNQGFRDSNLEGLNVGIGAGLNFNWTDGKIPGLQMANDKPLNDLGQGSILKSLQALWNDDSLNSNLKQQTVNRSGSSQGAGLGANAGANSLFSGGLWANQTQNNLSQLQWQQQQQQQQNVHTLGNSNVLNLGLDLQSSFNNTPSQGQNLNQAFLNKNNATAASLLLELQQQSQRNGQRQYGSGLGSLINDQLQQIAPQLGGGRGLQSNQNHNSNLFGQQLLDNGNSQLQGSSQFQGNLGLLTSNMGSAVGGSLAGSRVGIGGGNSSLQQSLQQQQQQQPPQQQQQSSQQPQQTHDLQVLLQQLQQGGSRSNRGTSGGNTGGLFSNLPGM
eukprot:TRINITY_DN1457_c0_g2_i1.p1 TRINITY_DN1457_c0_g2~~TRINITY_DN1457_c0_g2_i1.p1  ORF type:complete len:778 (-),score=88.55 TRINITY_DN1457_c0_g2_i1:284-2617(-)